MVSRQGKPAMIVAMDGPAGVGKSSVSERCAAQTGFVYLNSGNFYRAVTRRHLDLDRDPEDKAAIITTARETRIVIADNKILANGVDVTQRLHTDDVDSWVSQHSAIVPVRRIIVDRLRSVTEGLDVIVEGRDITTVVFPDAEIKIYLDASVDVRARRRYDQGTSGKSLEELKSNIEMRDRIDSSKEEGSLMVSDDASYIDTSDLTIDQVCDKVTGIIRRSTAVNCTQR